VNAVIREVVPEPLDLEDVLESIAAAARSLDAETYLVGGFVRDRLLGGGRGKDIDLVTVGIDPMPVLAAVARAFGWHPPERFERFGTAQIRGGTYVIEGVRARAERYDPESRNPDVRPGTQPSLIEFAHLGIFGHHEIREIHHVSRVEFGARQSFGRKQVFDTQLGFLRSQRSQPHDSHVVEMSYDEH